MAAHGQLDRAVDFLSLLLRVRQAARPLLEVIRQPLGIEILLVEDQRLAVIIRDLDGKNEVAFAAARGSGNHQFLGGGRIEPDRGDRAHLHAHSQRQAVLRIDGNIRRDG